MAVGNIGSGTQLLVDDGVSNAYVAIADAFSISLPWAEHQQVECTNLDSGGVVQRINGLIDPGTGSFKCRYTEAALDRMVDLLGVAHNFKIINPGSSTYVVNCRATKTELGEITPEGVQDFTMSLQGLAEGVFTVV